MKRQALWMVGAVTVVGGLRDLCRPEQGRSDTDDQELV